MRRTIKLALSCFCLTLNSSIAYAVELSDNVTLNGFGTFGLSKTSDSEYGYRNGIGSNDPVFDDWDATSRNVFGLQLNARFNNQWSSTLQAVHEQTYDNDVDRHIRLAALNYQVNPEWQLRFGRFSPKVFSLTDSRSVGYGYLWTSAPIEFYGQLETKTYDGMEINFTHQFNEVSSKTSFGFGRTSMPVSYNGNELVMDLTPAFGLNQDVEWHEFNFRASITGVKNRTQWIPSLRDAWQQIAAIPELTADAENAMNLLDADDSMLWIYSLGASYDNGDWVIQSEVLRLQSDSDIIPTTNSGYLSIGHRFGKFTPYVLLSTIRSKASDFNPSETYKYFETTPNPYSSVLTTLDVNTNSVLTNLTQDSVGLGVRWDLNEHFALKAQWDRKFVSAGANAMWWGVATSDSDAKTIDVFTINLDYVF